MPKTHSDKILMLTTAIVFRNHDGNTLESLFCDDEEASAGCRWLPRLDAGKEIYEHRSSTDLKSSTQVNRRGALCIPKQSISSHRTYWQTMARKLPWLTTSTAPRSAIQSKKLAATKTPRQHQNRSRDQPNDNDDEADLDSNYAAGDTPTSKPYKSTTVTKRRRTSPPHSSSPLQPSSPISPSQPLTSPTSITTAPPMMSGYDRDDIYMMVEDEFQSVAQDFTRHLHRAEYRRLRQRAKEAKALRRGNDSEDGEGGWMTQTRSGIDGELRVETKLALQSGALRAKQGRTLDKVLSGGSIPSTSATAAGPGNISTVANVLPTDSDTDEGEVDDEDDDAHDNDNSNRQDTAKHSKGSKNDKKDVNIQDPWAGTTLATLMSAASPPRKALVGLQAIPSSTKAAKGVVKHDEIFTGSSGGGQPRKHARGEDESDRDGRTSRPSMSKYHSTGTVNVIDMEKTKTKVGGQPTSTSRTVPDLSTDKSPEDLSSPVAKPKYQSIKSTKYALLSSDYTRNLLAELDEYDEDEHKAKSNGQVANSNESPPAGAASKSLPKSRDGFRIKQKGPPHRQGNKSDEQDGRQRCNDIPLFLV